QLRSQLSAASTGSSTETNSVISSAQQMLEEMGSLMNTQYDGQYVFAGGKTDTAPVDLTSFSSGTGSTTTADTSYYKGDDEIASASARQTDYKSYAESLSNDLTGVDVAAITAQLSTYQAQLTASYSAMSKILSMNLASYLK